MLPFVGDMADCPAVRLAGEHIPVFGGKHLEICEDVKPTDLDVAKLTLLSFHRGTEQYVFGSTMRSRAVTLKANLGLADAKRILVEQSKLNLPDDVTFIVFPGTVARRSDGYLIPCLQRRDNVWFVRWLQVDATWLPNVRLLRPRKSKSVDS